jgi:hypothetical protein
MTSLYPCMKNLLQFTRRSAAIAVLLLAVGAPLLRAADPMPFPPLAAPDPDHIAPKLRHRVDPVYPSGIEKPTERRIYVAFLVATDGSVRNASAMFGPPEPFATAAVEAVSQWKFKPGRIAASDRPVWTQMTVELWFKPPPTPKS